MRARIFVILLLMTAFPARAFESFIIQDIRVDGLSRIALGTVLNYLPINKGDTMDDGRSSETIRVLFETGFFDDVSLLREDGILVIKVAERPSISKIDISGNADITSEQLTEALKGIGLAEGEWILEYRTRLHLSHPRSKDRNRTGRRAPAMRHAAGTQRLRRRDPVTGYC